MKRSLLLSLITLICCYPVWALEIDNKSNQTLYLKLGKDCISVNSAQSVELAARTQTSIPQPVLPPSICLLMQVVSESENQVYQYHLPNTDYIHFTINEENGKISIHYVLL